MNDPKDQKKYIAKIQLCQGRLFWPLRFGTASAKPAKSEAIVLNCLKNLKQQQLWSKIPHFMAIIWHAFSCIWEAPTKFAKKKIILLSLRAEKKKIFTKMTKEDPKKRMRCRNKKSIGLPRTINLSRSCFSRYFPTLFVLNLKVLA
jgi:hypothetical protein